MGSVIQFILLSVFGEDAVELENMILKNIEISYSSVIMLFENTEDDFILNNRQQREEHLYSAHSIMQR